MKVIVIAWPGEGEYDLFLGCKQKGIDIEMFFVNIGHIRGYLGGLPGTGGDPPGLKYTMIGTSEVASVVKNNLADLYILKYPQRSWTVPADQSKVICWMTEYGSTLDYAEPCVLPFINIGSTYRAEMDYYGSKYHGKHIFYMPFGIYIPEVPSVVNPRYDVIVANRAPWDTDSLSNTRRQSVATMVTPLADYNIALYSTGWETFSNLASKHKGIFNHWEYPQVFAQTKMIVGITWNWETGGYSVQLPRALSSGKAVIWHKTPGMELEGWEKGNQFDWSSSAEETRALVDYYLSHDKEREEMGQRGREWVQQHWHWGKIIKDIVENL